ncbi:MAG: PAS domain S-box protein [Methylocapsa sp.]|nr:PAS domain S-box protein [Methylocapsa sp.]
MDNLISLPKAAVAALSSCKSEKKGPGIASEFESGQLLRALPVAVYATDACGRITFYNEAAAALWGCRPELGKDEWCGSWRLLWPDGTPMPHSECPMAVALREGRALTGAEAMAERPDGKRIPFLAYPTPLFDEAGALAGAVNTLIDFASRKEDELAAESLAAVVESSADAILGLDLGGRITSWNPAAARLYGYAWEEIVGKPVTVLIPSDRQDEEQQILDCIRRGESVDHYETIRRRKDGVLVDVSLTVSPIKDRRGQIVGASKTARDISERKQAEEQQRLLLREMNHRIKNLFTLASSLITLSTRFAATPRELAEAMSGRLVALARAHDLTLPDLNGSELAADRATTLPALVQTLVAPYFLHDQSAIRMSGPELAIKGKAAVALAMLLHELATNAAKFGALSCEAGHVDISWQICEDELRMKWQERGGPPIDVEPDTEGFGSLLTKLAATGRLGGKISRDWGREGLIVNLAMPLEKLAE